ncbi:MAG: hypothetical protein GKS01_12460 [Alphaproteobacteria bacterium]|nr:hypothetical protein [Alphaproteobacteria bacterium]
MKYLLSVTAAGFFALATITAAHACGGGHGKTAGISKPVTTADMPIMTPRPKTGG